MDTKYRIEIPKPCHENWDQMTPNATGRFCGSCTKSVVDFTNKTSTEIQHYFAENKGKSICGRLKNEQVQKFDIHIPQTVLNQKMTFSKAFLLVLFVVMGSSLFSCKNNEGFPLGEVAVVEDTIHQPEVLLGMVLPARDTINNKKHSQEAQSQPNPNIEEEKIIKPNKVVEKTPCKIIKEEDDHNILMGDVMFVPKDTISK
jgi:hypothetical protein